MRCTGVMASFLILQLSPLALGVASSSEKESSAIRLDVELVIGSEAGVRLGHIVDVAVDSRDHVYVLDASAPAVHEFTYDGRYLASMGGSGEAPGQFNAPHCLTVGSDDRLYVAGGDPYIEVFAANGKPIQRIKRAGGSPVQSIAVDDHGDIYVVALDLISQKMIEKYAGHGGQLVQSFCDSYAVGHDVDTREEEFYAQGSIAVHKDRVYYVQSYPHAIRIFDLSGALLEDFDARAAESKPPQTRIDNHAVQLKVPDSFSRTIVPLEDDLLLTILVLPFEGPSASGYLDLYRPSDGARIAAFENPPTPAIACRDRRGGLYSVEARRGAPVVVRYRLEAAAELTPGARTVSRGTGAP